MARLHLAFGVLQGSPRPPQSCPPKQLHSQQRQGQDSKPSQTCKFPLSGPSRTPPPGSQAARGASGPNSLRSFWSRLSAVFPRENSHLFQHSDFIKLGILKACFVFESELFGACRQPRPPPLSNPPSLGLPWHSTPSSSNWQVRPPHHAHSVNPVAIVWSPHFSSWLWLCWDLTLLGFLYPGSFQHLPL